MALSITSFLQVQSYFRRQTENDVTFRFDMRLSTPCRTTQRFTLSARQLVTPLLAPALPPTLRVYKYPNPRRSKKAGGVHRGDDEEGQRRRGVGLLHREPLVG